MEAHERGGIEHYRRPQEPGRSNHGRAQARDEAVGGREIWGPLARPVEDQQLVLEEHGFGDDRAGAARAQRPKSGPDEVTEQRGEIAHAQQRRVGLAECNRWKSKAFALQIAIRTPQVLEQQGPGGDGAHSPWAAELRTGDRHVDGNDEESTHRQRATMHATLRKAARRVRIPPRREFANHSGKRKVGHGSSNWQTQTSRLLLRPGATAGGVVTVSRRIDAMRVPVRTFTGTR